MEIREIYEDIKLNIQEATGNIIGKLKFQWIKAGSPTDKNRNSRYYDESLIKKIIKQFNSKNSHIAGQINHPAEGMTKLDKVSHVLTKLSYDEKTKIGHATAAILNTSSGRDMKVVVQQNLKDLGASVRGFGNLEKDGKVKESDYNFETIDVILKSSFENATIGSENLFESGNKHFEEIKEKEFDISLIQFNLMVEKYMSDIYDQTPNTSNLSEDRRKFYDENWVKYSEIIETQLEKKNLKIEEPKIKETKGEMYSEKEDLFSEAIAGGYKKSFEKFCEEVLPDVGGLSDSEIALELQYYEAEKSGFKGSLKEFKKIMEENQND